MPIHASLAKDAEVSTKANTAQIENGFIGEHDVLQKVPVSRKTWSNWKNKGYVPFIRQPGSRRVLYHWPSVESALLRLQKPALAA